MGDTVLLLGSNSFSGSHFAARLLEAGYRVLGVSRSPEPDHLGFTRSANVYGPRR